MSVGVCGMKGIMVCVVGKSLLGVSNEASHVFPVYHSLPSPNNNIMPSYVV